MNNSKINSFLSTLNFTLIFVGFFFVTLLFLPSNTTDTSIVRNVSIPYRAFTLALSLLVAFLCFGSRDRTKFPLSYLLFICFWILYIIRIAFDSFLRIDTVYLTDNTPVWAYIFGICIPLIISISISYKFIDLDRAFSWILNFSGIIFLLIVFKNSNILGGAPEVNEIRHQANIAISSISFGNFGAMVSILGYAAITKKTSSKYLKLYAFFLILIGLFFVLRAGSRGPIFGLLSVFLFLTYGRNKNILNSIFFLFLSIVALMLTFEFILNWIGSISPLLEMRIRSSFGEDGLGSRTIYYSTALEQFLENPIFGSKYLIVFENGKTDYVHNIFLDALLATGIIGFLALIYFLFVGLVKSRNLLMINHPHSWLGLLLIQQIIFNMFSGAFYLNPTLSALLTIILLKFKDSRYLVQH